MVCKVLVESNQVVRNKGYEKLCLKYSVHVLRTAAVRTTYATSPAIAHGARTSHVIHLTLHTIPYR